MPILFRSMQEDEDGLPAVGPRARTLGVRDGIDIIVDSGYVLPGTGGMSVSPEDPRRLPRFRRPSDLGGTGRDPTFGIDSNALPQALAFREDPVDPIGHGFIEPAYTMPFKDYQQAITETRRLWKRHTEWRH